MDNVCECGIVSFSNDFIVTSLGRDWSIGPCVIQQKGSALSISMKKSTLEHSLFSLNEFKNAVGRDLRIPIKIQVAQDLNSDPYGFGVIDFDDSIMGRFKSSAFSIDAVTLEFEALGGRELSIFNGNSNSDERSGSEKPLFWASILKGNLH